MHKEKFLFLNRVKPGVLGSHQKSKKRTKIHHQRKMKTLRKKHTKFTIFRQKHTFRSFNFGKRPKVLKQQLYESDLSPETIETITLEREPINTNRTIQTIPTKRGGKEINIAQKSTKHSVSVYIFQKSFLQKHGEKHYWTAKWATSNTRKKM